MTEQQENYEAWKDSFRESAGEIRCGKPDEHGTRRCTVCNEIMPVYTIHSHETPFSAYDQDKFTYKDGKLERNQEELQTARSINNTLQERGENYGDFDSQAFISQGIKFAMSESYPEKWDKLYSRNKEALEMIAHKIARIINGNQHYADSWHDIAGYATLAEKECNNG